jgi:hypothetical protein|nr:MAG TPA: Protein of unknown function (DUF2730) [Crassvirales sp.]
MKLPVSYDQFVKNPIVGLMFLCISGLVYIYFTSSSDRSASLEQCTVRVEKLEADKELLSVHLRKRDSALAYASAMLTLKEIAK